MKAQLMKRTRTDRFTIDLVVVEMFSSWWINFTTLCRRIQGLRRTLPTLIWRSRDWVRLSSFQWWLEGLTTRQERAWRQLIVLIRLDMRNSMQHGRTFKRRSIILSWTLLWWMKWRRSFTRLRGRLWIRLTNKCRKKSKRKGLIRFDKRKYNR